MKCKNNKVLIFKGIPLKLISDLNKIGLDCIKIETTNLIEIYKLVADCIGIVIRSSIVIDKKLIDTAKKLKFIARFGSGLESIDVQYAQKKGIHCINSPEGNAVAVAEYCLASLIFMSRNIYSSNYFLKNNHEINRDSLRGNELNNLILGIIGYGNTGKAFAKLSKPFCKEILVNDILNKKVNDKKIKQVDLENIFKNADVVSLHIPYNTNNHYFVDNNFINKFKKNIILINTSRGKILNTNDLIINLSKKKIISAVLDVLEFEDNTFDKFLINFNEKKIDLNKFPNLIITPHIAGLSIQSNIKNINILLKKIKKIFLI